MPFDGAGNFKRAYNWVSDAANAALDFITPSRMDADANDIAAGLSDCITRDGQSPPTANLPMAGKILTGLGPGANPGDSITFDQVQAMLAKLLPTGAQIQFGSAVSNANGNVVVAFPKAFPNAASAVFCQVTANDVRAYTVQVSGISNSIFSVNVNVAQNGGGVAPAPGIGFFWLAIGS